MRVCDGRERIVGEEEWRLWVVSVGWWMERSVDGRWRGVWDESNGRMWEEGCGGWTVHRR